MALAGGVAKGIADKGAADSSAGAQRRNADVADEAAAMALQKGENEALHLDMQASSLKGLQRASYAAAGVDSSQGSAARTQSDTDFINELDKQTARNNAQKEAWGLVQRADTMRSNADSTESAGTFSLFGDLIGGGASAIPYFASAGKKVKAPGKEE